MRITRALRDMRTMKQLFAETEAEADRLGDQNPGAEHLLLAALSLPDGSAQRVFDREGVSRDALRDAIARVHEDALTAAGLSETGRSGALPGALERPRTGPLRLTEPAQAAFRRATALAKSERRPIAGADVVVGVAELEHGTAARTLELLGISRPRLIESALAR
ncbi:Clp protease N-terminal domain-containing protein [Rhodococcus maanshanensis]|uniref:Clp amino terminal domain-containing protein, pathogenicity island component n=1 Tax=Rhodococcus maanshanensis TaxID=183556 RepID=A0A1H7QXB8_9NOCA|nr:Clp protease N-terminal domain-containing protein [Rhodococcus maanshanensis]SEL52626.1 Clp amino terminal domain-containing protein, pathogenicity island component [Rhodococcus maanshanensis]